MGVDNLLDLLDLAIHMINFLGRILESIEALWVLTLDFGQSLTIGLVKTNSPSVHIRIQ